MPLKIRRAASRVLPIVPGATAGMQTSIWLCCFAYPLFCRYSQGVFYDCYYGLLVFRFKTSPIFTVGDAMASYLEHPDFSTRSMLYNQSWTPPCPTAIRFLGDIRKPTLSSKYWKRSVKLLLTTLDRAHMMSTRKRVKKLTIWNIHSSDENEVISQVWLPNAKGFGWPRRLYYYSWTLAIICAATTIAIIPQWRDYFSIPQSSADTMWIVEVSILYKFSSFIHINKLNRYYSSPISFR